MCRATTRFCRTSSACCTCRAASSTASAAGSQRRGHQAPHARPLPDGPEARSRLRSVGHWSARPDPVQLQGTPGDALGGSMYWGASMEFQIAALLPAQGCRHEGRGLRRRGLALELQGPDQFPDGPGATGGRSPARPRSGARVRSTTACSCVRQSAPACCGRRRSDRSASTSRYRSPRSRTTGSSSSASAAGRHSDRVALQRATDKVA